METMEEAQGMPVSESVLDLPEDIKIALCTVKVRFMGKDRQFIIKDELSIDYDNIEKDMEEFPNKFHLWAMLYSEVKEQKGVIDKKVRIRKSKIYEEIVKNDGKNLRRSDITDIMESDKVLEELEAKMIIIDKQCQKLWFILESLRMKNDNMRSLSGFKKQELFQTSQSV